MTYLKILKDDTSNFNEIVEYYNLNDGKLDL